MAKPLSFFPDRNARNAPQSPFDMQHIAVLIANLNPS